MLLGSHCHSVHAQVPADAVVLQVSGQPSQAAESEQLLHQDSQSWFESINC